MNFQWFLDHAELVVMALQAVFLFVLWLLQKSFASKDDVNASAAAVRAEIAKVTDALDAELKRVAAIAASTAGQVLLLENKMAGFPTSDDVAEIKLSIAEMSGDYKAIKANVDNMDGHIESIGKSVDRIESWLMEAAKASR